MELVELRYFIRVSELNSISKVAAENNVAASAVSSHISNLERDLGYLLFDRKGKSVWLNEKGEILYRHAVRLLNLVDDAKREIKDRNLQLDYEIRISTLTIPKVLPHLIRSFTEQYPQARLKVSQYQKKRDIQDMGCDIMLYSAYTRTQQPNTVTIYEEPIVLLVSKEHPLAREQSVSIDRIRGERFICPSRISDLGQRIYKVMDEWRLEPRIVAVSDYPSYVLELIAAGVGISFQPSLTYRYYGNPNIVPIKLQEMNLVRYISIMWNDVRYRPKVAELFIRHAAQFMRGIDETSLNGKEAAGGPPRGDGGSPAEPR